MIKQKKQGNLIIISGTTCAGKGAVIDALLNNHALKCVESYKY